MLASSFFIGRTPSSISLIKGPIIYFFDSRSPSRQKLSFSYRMCLNWTFLEGIAPKSSVLRPNQLHHWRQISVNGHEQRFYKFLITQVTFKVCFAIVQYTFRIFGVILLDFLAWFNFSWTQTASLFCLNEIVTQWYYDSMTLWLNVLIQWYFDSMIVWLNAVFKIYLYPGNLPSQLPLAWWFGFPADLS